MSLDYRVSATAHELDPAIASIVVNGCPMGHSTEQMTLGEMFASPDMRKYVAEPIKNIETLKANGMEDAVATRIALGGVALTDDSGELVRRVDNRPAEALEPQPAGAEKK